MAGVGSVGGINVTSTPSALSNATTVHYPPSGTANNTVHYPPPGTMMSANSMSPAAGSNAVQPGQSPVKPSIGSVTAPSATSSPMSISQGASALRTTQPTNTDTTKVLDRRRIQQLVREVDPLEQLDDEVEEILLQIADDFIDNVVSASCQLALHRKATTVEVRDVQLHLERCWNMMIPGFGNEDLKPYRKSATTEAHKQRLALIKKTLKKY